MKKTALTVAISGLLLAGGAQAATVYDNEGTKLDIYGRMVGLYYGSDNEGEQGDQSYARVGVRGETQLVGGWTGFGKIEKQLNGDQSEHLRHLNVGAANEQFGTVTYGRQFGLFYSQLAANTDMLMEFGNDGLGDGTDKFGTGRNSALLTYTYAFDGLTLGAQATLANESDDSYKSGEDISITPVDESFDMKKGSEEGYALSAGYDFGNGFALAAAYNEAGKTDDQSTYADFGGDDRAKLAGFGMKYTREALYAAINYSQGSDHLFVNGGFAEEHKGLEAVVQYQFTPELLLGTAYIQTDVQEGRNGHDFDGTYNNYVSIHGSYSFKPNFFLYADYKLNLLDDEEGQEFDVNTDDVFALGLQYNF